MLKIGEFSTLDESLEVNLYILEDDIKSMLEGMIGSDKLGHKKAGTYTKTTAELQDFVCNLVINNTQIQQL